MDIWKFYDVTHRFHTICNPLSPEKIGRLVDLLRLDKDSEILDIAMGKGEFLFRTVEKYGSRGVGVDLSPFYVEDARRRAERSTSGDRVKLLEMDGADYKPDPERVFDVTVCLGASWIYGGYRGTLKFLKNLTKNEGYIAVGEPYWKEDPPQEYCEAVEVKKEDFLSHEGNLFFAEKMGLRLAHILTSSEDDWNIYEGLTWYAADRHRKEHPDDPDLPEILEKLDREKRAYIQHGRSVLGWAVYLFRNV